MLGHEKVRRRTRGMKGVKGEREAGGDEKVGGGTRGMR
jgi:hypothetical protein